MKTLLAFALIASVIVPVQAQVYRCPAEGCTESAKVEVPEASDAGVTTSNGEEAVDPNSGRTYKEIAAEVVVPAMAPGTQVIIVASSEEHARILKERLADRLPSLSNAPTAVRMLGMRASNEDIITALSVPEGSGVKAVILDADFAVNAAPSGQMDYLRSQGIYARAIGTRTY